MICMISDGMGNGENAARSSRLITSLFQRMIISGIPQDSAIRCINKLIQSDTYATLECNLHQSLQRDGIYFEISRMSNILIT